MGDVIQTFSVRSQDRERSRRLRLYFDTGSPETFIKRSASKGFGARLRILPPEVFGGLGNGRFEAREQVHLKIKMLGMWCRHAAYVVNDSLLEPGEDMLVGHDLMQKLNIRVDPRRHRVLLDRATLRRSRIVR